MVDIPRTRYVEGSDGLHIAYQVIGDGPLDLALLPTNWSNVELHWDDPFTARFFRRLGSIGRLVTFDKRGTGLSDPVPLRVVPRRRSGSTISWRSSTPSGVSKPT